MAKEIIKTTGGHASPFERIKRANDAGMEFWSSRDFSEILNYGDYRNFEGVIEKAKLSCFNSGHRIEDHFVDVTEMVAIGSDVEIFGVHYGKKRGQIYFTNSSKVRIIGDSRYVRPRQFGR